MRLVWRGVPPYAGKMTRVRVHPYHFQVLGAMPDAELDGLLEAIAARDLTASLSAFSVDRDPAIMGSESGEVAIGREEVESFFRRLCRRPSSFRFDFPTRTWQQRSEVAWLVAEGTVLEPSATTTKPYRLTGVFIREHGVWKLNLWSGAEPVRSE